MYFRRYETNAKARQQLDTDLKAAASDRLRRVAAQVKAKKQAAKG